MNAQNNNKKGLWPPGFKQLFVVGCVSLCFMNSCSEPENTNGSGAEMEKADTVTVADNDTLNAGGFEATSITYPEGYEVISETEGDLDGDAISEKVVVLNTDETGEMGIEREIRIYVQTDGYWSLWHQYQGAVLPSEHGGMMGDPFEKLEIHNQNIMISHFGGSSDKWSYTHEFKYNNETWELTAATLIYFRNCAYSETYTYDFEGRTCFHTKHIESCNEDGLVLDKTTEVDELLEIESSVDIPTIDDFTPGGTLLELDGESESYYL
jgi:hypothetical protein